LNKYKNGTSVVIETSEVIGQNSLSFESIRESSHPGIRWGKVYKLPLS